MKRLKNLLDIERCIRGGGCETNYSALLLMETEKDYPNSAYADAGFRLVRYEKSKNT